MKAGKLKVITGDDEYPYKLMDKHDFEDCKDIVKIAVQEKFAIIQDDANRLAVFSLGFIRSSIR